MRLIKPSFWIVKPQICRRAGFQEKIIAKKFQFFPSRLENIRVFSNAALNLLRLFIEGKIA
jgi:hypothetical protein